MPAHEANPRIVMQVCPLCQGGGNILQQIALKFMRLEASMTQQELADKLSYAVNTIRTYENGKYPASELYYRKVNQVYRTTPITSRPPRIRAGRRIKP